MAQKQFPKYDDEICRCGHSKGYHGEHQFDSHGAGCDRNDCECAIYTWAAFVKYLKI